MIPHHKVMQALQEAELAVLVQDQARMFKSQQALTDHYNNKMLGVPIPEDEMIHIGDVTLPPEKRQQPQNSGLPLKAIALGAALAGLPILGYLLANKDPVIKTVEKIVEKPIETIIEKPGKDYTIDVDMEVTPPQE